MNTPDARLVVFSVSNTGCDAVRCAVAKYICFFPSAPFSIFVFRILCADGDRGVFCWIVIGRSNNILPQTTGLGELAQVREDCGSPTVLLDFKKNRVQMDVSGCFFEKIE